MINTNFKQQHFVIYELQLPYCTVCTPANDLTEPWHTPITCEESSDDIYSLWFTDNKAPIMSPPAQSIAGVSRLNSAVWRVVANASESTPRLKPAEGMASRGTMSITLNDFEGDPGPINFSESGTFFGKLKARNVLDGKKIISRRYTITDDQTAPQLVDQSVHFVESANLTSGKFTIKAKDALKDLEAFSQKFPLPTEATLSADINDSTVTIPVSDGALFAVDDVIIIGEELMRVQSVLANDLTVYARGSEYLAPDSEIIYKTEVFEHSADSNVQKCYVMPKAFLSNVLQDVFNEVGLADYVDFTQWDDEITDWNSNAFLYGVFHEPTDADKLINMLLTNYMVDMWLDQSTQKARISATTAWKQSIRTITEDNDLYDLRTETRANTRFSRAFLYNKKPYQARNDDTTNYEKLTLFKDTATESDDLYGSVKVQEFDPSNFISDASAFILVSRYVQRFSRTPELLTFKMEERKLEATGLGDVVDIVTRDSQTPSGEFLESRVRAQVIEIKPNFNQIGRTYNVSALSYVPLIATGGDLVIFISGTVFDINLYSRAGAPPNDVNVTYVFDAATVGSTSVNIPAIRAGGFTAGSAIKLIFTNGSKISARGGAGGDVFLKCEQSSRSVTAYDAEDGADVYQSDGITSELYVNYGTVDGYVTDCDLFAAGGGGGSAAITVLAQGSGSTATAGAASAGGGGSGIPGGSAGIATKTNNTLPQCEIFSGGSGSFTTGGVSSISESDDIGYISTQQGTIANSQVRVTATPTDGGASGDALVSSTSYTIGLGQEAEKKEATGNTGLAGGAIRGTNVTVYNLEAQSARFKQGNSDSFNLITA